MPPLTATPQARAITRRELRFASGLVLFAYITVHFVDHALGLVSIDLAEAALHVSVVVWQSAPGTLLLYGAAAIHVALAFLAVYERRTLRMPPAQALRIALGFGMPLLVIGHVVATRMATERFGLTPTYARVVWTLWTSDSEGRQLALLAPGWVHGCLGLDFALGRHVLWQRLRPLLFGAALLLPVLAGLGFLSMGRELDVLATNPAWLQSAEVVDAAQRIWLGRLRDLALATYLALVGLVFAARSVRARVERQRRSVIEIAYPHRTIDVPRGWSVLEGSRSFGLPHLSMCGGNARCSTCRVRVVAGAANCPPPSAIEQRTLRRIDAPDDVRLACQLRPVGDVAVVPVLDPAFAFGAGRDAQPPVVERDVALLCVRIVAWRSCRDSPHSPHDVLYALNRVLAVVGDAIGAAGGLCGRLDNDGGTAIFGVTTDRATACRQALGAAAEIDRGLTALGQRLAREVGFVPAFALAVHVGASAVGPVGYGRERARDAVGETVQAAHALREHAARHGMRFALSRAAAEAAGIDTGHVAWQRLPVEGGDATLEMTGGAQVAVPGVAPASPDAA